MFGLFPTHPPFMITYVLNLIVSKNGSFINHPVLFFRNIWMAPYWQLLNHQNTSNIKSLEYYLGSCDQKKSGSSYGITYCITSKKIMHKKYVIMCWRVRKRRNSTGSKCSVRFPSGKHTMTSMCLVLVILTYYSAFYLLPTYLEHTYV